jgi:DNA-directed RNA polymerase subunit RPC12/RpoP
MAVNDLAVFNRILEVKTPTDIVPYDPAVWDFCGLILKKLERICSKCGRFMVVERIGMGGQANLDNPVDIFFPFTHLRMTYAKMYTLYFCQNCGRFSEVIHWESHLA